MTRRGTTRIDAATRRARTRNLRRRAVGPARTHPDAQPTPAPEEPRYPAPLTDEERDRLEAGWHFLE